MDANELLILIWTTVAAASLAAIFAFRKSSLWQIPHFFVLIPLAGMIAFYGSRWDLSARDFREMLFWSIFIIPFWIGKIELGALASLLFGHAIRWLVHSWQKKAA
jgi:uncharacterized membrane protein YfcA